MSFSLDTQMNNMALDIKRYKYMSKRLPSIQNDDSQNHIVIREYFHKVQPSLF